jgi:hypothetical protein
MNSNIEYCSPAKAEMDKIVQEWWNRLDQEFKKSGLPPKRGVLSASKKHVYV